MENGIERPRWLDSMASQASFGGGGGGNRRGGGRGKGGSFGATDHRRDGERGHEEARASGGTGVPRVDGVAAVAVAAAAVPPWK